MSLLSLYDICFNYLKEHTEDITDLIGIPFDPVVKDLVSSLFVSETPKLNSSILSVVGKCHGAYLRKLKPEWTTVDLFKGTLEGSELPTLVYLSKSFPKYVTRLCVSYSDIQDDDILLLNSFTHLTSLNMDYSPNITDTCITYVARMNENNNLPFLESIFLANNKQITDRSLRYIARMKTLCFVNLSNTGVTPEIAMRYLSKQGLQHTKFKTQVWLDERAKMSEVLHRAIKNWVQNTQPDRNKRLSHWSYPKEIDNGLYFRRSHNNKSNTSVQQPAEREKRKEENFTDKTTSKMNNKKSKLNSMDYLSMIEADLFIKQ
jgi:hypothetical protein